MLLAGISIFSRNCVNCRANSTMIFMRNDREAGGGFERVSSFEEGNDVAI